ncbi:MAG: hypothetical protein HRU26_01785 [Psychroserpens sp.]|nr:hypothetical protein [Psychroserpens sp.]
MLKNYRLIAIVFCVVKNLINESEIASQSDLEKTKYIYDHVRSNYKWNGSKKLLNDVSLKSLLQNKSGSASEVNMLLLQLLRLNDIEAKPLLTSTRDNGFITKIYPVLTDFNYMLVYAKIDNTEYLLDANDDLISFGQIPYMCLNQYGRLFNLKKGNSWYEISPKAYSTVAYRGELDLTADQINGTFSMKNTDYRSYFLKNSYTSDSNNILNNIINKPAEVEISSDQTLNIKKDDAVIDLDFDVKLAVEPIGNKIFLNPYLVEFYSENPFKLQERSYPVDFGFKQNYTYSAKINFGEDLIIEELPQPKKLNLPEKAGTLISNYQQQGNSVTIFLKFSFNKPIYEVRFYDSLKEFLNILINVQKDTVIVFSQKE